MLKFSETFASTRIDGLSPASFASVGACRWSLCQ